MKKYKLLKNERIYLIKIKNYLNFLGIIELMDINNLNKILIQIVLHFY